MIPPDDEGIIDCVKAASDREIPEMPFEQALAEGRIVPAGREVDDAYIAAVVGESVSHARDLSIVYTPAPRRGRDLGGRGTCHRGVQQGQHPGLAANARRRLPQRAGPRVQPGEPQDASRPRSSRPGPPGPTSSWPATPTPTGSAWAIPVSGDPNGQWTTLDGNQIGVLLAAFVIKETEALGRLRSDHYLVTTLVSTQMARAVAQREGIRTEDDLLVGFKWIAQRIDEAGFAGFLFGFEESHGYLKGTYARDKDAAVASLLFAELAATVKDRKQTVMEYLDDLYIDVGHYGEHLINKTYKGREGLDKIRALMKAFRTSPPRTIAGLSGHRGVRLPGPRDPRPGRRPGQPPPARAVGRPADLPHGYSPASGSRPGPRAPSRRSSSTSSPGPR